MRGKLIEANRKLSSVEEEIAARHKGDALFGWFMKSSGAVWKSVERLQDFFRAMMKRGRHISNPFLGIGFLLVMFVSGIVTVALLGLVVAPLLQITLVLVAAVATVCRGILRAVRVIR